MAAAKQVSTDAARYISPREGPHAPAGGLSNGTPDTPASSLQSPENDLGADIIIEDQVDVALCVHRNADEYNMDHLTRGRAVILNHFAFDSGTESERPGTNQDVEALKSTLPKIGFRPQDITVHGDLTKKGIIREMRKLAKEDHRKNDCLMVFVLTHGKSRGQLLARDQYYNVKCLWEPFLANKCTSLAGKPKMFMIQACRGSECGKIVNVRSGLNSQVHVDSAPVGVEEEIEYKIPSHADFLMAYSTVEGQVCFRDRLNGSWFIQTLCDILSMPNMTLNNDIVRILTRTNHRIAVGDPDCEVVMDITDITHCTTADSDNTTALVTDKAVNGDNKMAEHDTDNTAATALVTDKAVHGDNKMAEHDSDNTAATALVTDKAVLGDNKMAEHDTDNPAATAPVTNESKGRKRPSFENGGSSSSFVKKANVEVHRLTRQAPSFNSSLTREVYFRLKAVVTDVEAMTD